MKCKDCATLNQDLITLTKQVIDLIGVTTEIEHARLEVEQRVEVLEEQYHPPCRPCDLCTGEIHS